MPGVIGLHVAIGLFLSGCTLLGPDAATVAPVTPGPEVPPVSLNGAVGQPVMSCVDGCVETPVSDPASLPTVTLPVEIDIPDRARIERVSAIGSAAPEDRRDIEIPADGTSIAGLPHGTVTLTVLARFDDGSTVEYLWRVFPSRAD